MLASTVIRDKANLLSIGYQSICICSIHNFMTSFINGQSDDGVHRPLVKLISDFMNGVIKKDIIFD